VKYTVLRDTREQQGWTFAASKSCEGTQEVKLPTGDYSLLGYNDFVIERKGTTGEFAKNIVENRFEEELKRMEKIAFPFMVLEFTMAEIINFPKGSGIPINLWPSLRINPFFLLKRFIEFQMQYKTKIILAGKYGKDIASSLFKRRIEYAKQEEV
jgi:hypothetical protein